MFLWGVVNKRLINKIANKHNLTSSQVGFFIRLFCSTLKTEFLNNKIGVEIRGVGKFYYRFDLERVHELKEQWRKEGISEEEIVSRVNRDLFEQVRTELGYENKRKVRRRNFDYSEEREPIILDNDDFTF